MAWANENQIQPIKFCCGYCNNIVATNKGFFNKEDKSRAYPCPFCQKITFFDASENQTPGVTPGNEVDSLPKELEAIYNEARRCISINAFTAAVLACRKLLMHIAVDQNADPGKSFLFYVEYLADNGYVPPNGKGWVDHIRKKGNEANHEIVIMTANDAMELISFSEMLLKFIYEFPSRVPTTP